MKVTKLKLLLVGVSCLPLAQAAPYGGSGVACTPSSTAATCKIDILEFMKSKYEFTTGGRTPRTYVADSTNLSASANATANSAFQYIKAAGRYYYDIKTGKVLSFTDDVTVRQGFMNHPTLPNVLMHSKGGSNTLAGGTVEYFRWTGGADNSVYVISEPAYKFHPDRPEYGFRSYSQTEPAPNMNWRNRGYFWADKEFDVSRNPANPNEWLAPVRSWLGSHHDEVDWQKGKFRTRNVDGTINSVQVRYYPNENGAWINEGGGMLPSGPMEVLAVVLRRHHPKDGSIFWWERYDYARQKQANGAYQNFGMIRFSSSLNYAQFPNAPKCTNGLPPAPGLKCGDFDFVVEGEGHYNAFTSGTEVGQTVQQWYQTALSEPNKARNDPKLTKRSTAEDLILPNNRGGFIPLGNGADAKGVGFVGGGANGDMLYLEASNVEQDWYVYPNGRDPLFAPALSPTNYCRDGYKYLASFPASKSYNGLTGSVEDTGNLHWVIVCGTSTDLYFHGSNGGGDPSCNNGYITRGWWANPYHLTVSTCYPNGSCSDQASKQYINMCVSSKETQFTYPAPNP